MSKNIYRVNKKSDLDEIMKNHFYKPVCIIFASKSVDTKLYSDITGTLSSMSKHLTYLMIVLIDFDDFIDNNNFFADIKSNVPFFLAFFKGKNIMSEQDKENFIPLVVNHMDQIHKSYLNKLIQTFNQSQEVNQQSTENVQQNQSLQNNLEKEINDEPIDELNNDVHSSHSENSSKQSKSSKSSSSSKKSSNSESSKSNSSESLKKKSKKKSKKTTKSDNLSDEELSNSGERIVKEKAKLKKIKELQKLKELLKN